MANAKFETADLESAATISFAADGGGATLGGLQGMVTASQRSNMAAYLPTDCPTREKHGWLGDAQATPHPGQPLTQALTP